MDATKFVLETRLSLLDYANDYSAYASRLSTRLASTKKRLGVQEKHPATHHLTFEMSPAQIAKSNELFQVPLLAAERCWAKSMAWRSRDTVNSATRSQVVTKLVQANKIVEKLLATLMDQDSGASSADILSSWAYGAVLKGDVSFREKKWQQCLESYSSAKIIYSVLHSSMTEDNNFKDFVTNSVDTPLRFAQRQLGIPTTFSILALAKMHFPLSDEELYSKVEEFAPGFLKQDEDTLMTDCGPLKTATWRNRKVPVEDAEIALKLDALDFATSALSQKLSSSPDLRPNNKAESYDAVLEISNDVVDATQQAIDELKEQGIAQGDARMQNLVILLTKLKYDLLSWQIGRNRVLMGEKDGALLESGPSENRMKSPLVNRPAIADSQQVKQLGKKVNLYDKTLQSLKVATELPGVLADDDLATEIAAVVNYFTALKSLAIAQSHLLIGNPTNALALTKHAYDLCEDALPVLSKHTDSNESGLRTIEVVQSEAAFLQNLLIRELQHSRALVQISNLRQKGCLGGTAAPPRPLLERLGQYPAQGVELENIVIYPPTLEPIPAKPLFLDLAWNHVQYPTTQRAQPKASQSKVAASNEPEKQPASKGWFRFGRG